MRRSKEDAEQTRESILDTAEELFCTKGVARTTLEAIARAAGVTRGAFYWHFRDKDDLLEALHTRAAHPQEAILRAAAAGEHPDPMALLQECGGEMLELFEQDIHRQRLFLIMTAVKKEDETLQPSRQKNTDVYNVLRSIARQASHLGMLNGPYNDEEAAVVMMATMNGLLSEWLRGEKSFSLASLGRRLLANQIEMLRGSPPP